MSYDDESSNSDVPSFLFFMGIYLSSYYMINISPSMRLFEYSFLKIWYFFEGEFSFQGFTFLLIIASFVFLQSRAAFKILVTGEEVKKYDPLYWPAYIGFLAFCVKFISMLSILNLSSLHDAFHHWWSFLVAVILIIIKLYFIVMVSGLCGLVFAIYSSIVIHFSLISLFTGLIASVAHYFIFGEVDLVKMYFNFLDSFVLSDFLFFGEHYLVAILSLLATLAASIYRFADAYGFIDYFF